MFVKTTKGIYELTPNRHLTDYPIIDNGRTMGIKQKLFENKSYIYYGDVVAQSDNADDLISEIVAIDNKNRKVYIAKSQIKRYLIEFGDRIIALTWIGDDLLKTFEWDNEKGEWKLYER